MLPYFEGKSVLQGKENRTWREGFPYLEGRNTVLEGKKLQTNLFTINYFEFAKVF